ncbi:Transposase [Acetobacter malorum]|uniref:Transposase n=1 Tax=Acetobacter malorum TaxID=178901 RepID=A0A177G608_9PROT|nr:Transposase [Acetobacter malorum]
MISFLWFLLEEWRPELKQAGFFDVEERLAQLSGLGDQLEAFSQTMGFKVSRPNLPTAQAYVECLLSAYVVQDGTLVAAPEQHNTNEEKADIQKERIRKDW